MRRTSPLRHTFLTRLGESGCDAWSLARIAGHSNIRMSSRYVAYLMGRTGGDLRQTLAAYYQGYGSLQKFGILPVTDLYIADILALQPMFA